MKKIKIVRIILVVGTVVAFFWLHFRGISNLGMFHSLPNSEPIPQTGTAVISFSNGKAVEAYAINGVKRGWVTIWMGGPIALFYTLFGITIGHFLGEADRRKFAVNESMPEKLREEICLERSAMRTATFYTRHEAECLLNKANDIYIDAQEKKEQAAADQRRISVLRITLEEQVQNAGQLRRDLESIKGELANAKKKLEQAEARNKKLKKKLRARLEKWIDESDSAEII
ncbi:MAG: hypothetical protein ACYC2W_01380 [Desulfurivibrionaceae bacterium]